MQNNKKRLRKTNLLLLSLALLPSLVFSQQLSVADYAFEKNVIIEDNSTNLAVQLDAESLQSIDERFGNFNVFDEDNQNIEFNAFYQNSHVVKGMDILDVSSQRKGDPAAIADGKFTTSFLFSEKEDKKNDSWFLLDLGRAQPLSRIELFVSEGSRIKEVEIQGGATIDSLEKIYDKKAFKKSLELSKKPYVRYLKVSLWGLRIQMDNVRITTAREGIVYLNDVNKNQRIKFLYGGISADQIKYTERYSSPASAQEFGKLTKQKWNPDFPKDVDEDGKVNEDDNCAFVKNKLQFDKDGDRVGDACDNAPSVKNINQNDTDGDEVGDIIDNCKLEKNADQSDRDSDGLGDACDTAHAESNGMNPNILMYLFGIILLVFVLKTIWSVSSKNKN